MDTHIFIPVAGSDEVVAVPLAELPAEAEDLLDILKAEEAPLSLWLDFARAYLAEVSARSTCALQQSTRHLILCRNTPHCMSKAVLASATSGVRPCLGVARSEGGADSLE